MLAGMIFVAGMAQLGFAEVGTRLHSANREVFDRFVA
jgi:hypothetical protein